jgi:hypothetical protein
MVNQARQDILVSAELTELLVRVDIPGSVELMGLRGQVVIADLVEPMVNLEHQVTPVSQVKTELLGIPVLVELTVHLERQDIQDFLEQMEAKVPPAIQDLAVQQDRQVEVQVKCYIIMVHQQQVMVICYMMEQH